MAAKSRPTPSGNYRPLPWVLFLRSGCLRLCMAWAERLARTAAGYRASPTMLRLELVLVSRLFAASWMRQHRCPLGIGHSLVLSAPKSAPAVWAACFRSPRIHRRALLRLAVLQTICVIFLSLANP